ncbi:FAD-binding protein [Gordoniibacillus kamchatkensis]|uniref:FAD-binding protein n=1 Tax=Gordoniibacillus kamchatkensis TaxID=1590651 RepID=A0ABR5AN50_9BACL|nr:FAD-binding oxidoreductase [Paenibacillus sp. VKM B-2647]KIL42446.1 FAD-binding protein [Paenibacillus sp. VKM B-2647]
MKKSIALLLLAALSLYVYVRNDVPDQDPYAITDYSRLHPVKVERVVKGQEERQLVAIVQEARQKGLTVSIAGQRHSQGGHTYYKDGIVVDMTSFNRILAVDPARKTVRVQAGATWKDVQDAVNPYGLAVKTKQSQNIFTVGGSISINAHGRDIRNGSLIKSVESFRLLTADGQIKQVSRTENADLFPLALGGYGLFGIILDVTLTLADDEMYRITSDRMSVGEYSAYFQNRVKSNPDIRLHLARISVAPDSFLTDMYAINYTVDRSIPLRGHDRLNEGERLVIPTKLMFNLNRSFDWGKNVFWDLQKRFFGTQQGTVISRNNAMRSESGFMEYREAGKNDLLQEYFIPPDELSAFVEDFKAVLRSESMNLLNITVRYVNRDEEAKLSYAREDMFALVCLFNVPLTEQGQTQMKQSVQRILDAVMKHRGTYYLPYAPYASLDQFRAMYPNYGVFFNKKDEYDPEHLFMNYFYENYRGE